MALFRGSGVALVTPMHADKSVNYEMLKKLLLWHIQEGTDAVIVCGTTGEPCTLTQDERRQVIACAVETVQHRIPVIAGCGSNCTKETIRAAIEAQALGADGLLVVTPYYNKATQKGLYEHYASIARAVTIPIILYNVPSRTGCNLLPQTAVQLGGDFSNIAAIKEASGNLSQVVELAALLEHEPCLSLYSGNDDIVIPLMSVGAKGVISVLANIVPRVMHTLVTEYLNGNIQKARRLQLQYEPLIRALFLEVNPIGIKCAMNAMGWDVGGLRLPLTELTKEHKLTLRNAMSEAGLALVDR